MRMENQGEGGTAQQTPGVFRARGIARRGGYLNYRPLLKSQICSQSVDYARSVFFELRSKIDRNDLCFGK